MKLSAWIETNSSSDTERAFAQELAANYLESEVIRESGDSNFAACRVEEYELLLNGTDSTMYDVPAQPEPTDVVVEERKMGY